MVNIARKKLLYIKEELLLIVSIYGTTPQYDRLERTFVVHERYKKKIFLDRIIFYIIPSIIYLLEENKQKQTEYDLHILHILFNNVKNVNYSNKQFKYSMEEALSRLYDYKKYYTQNQSEYGEYNENKIFNKQ